MAADQPPVIEIDDRDLLGQADWIIDGHAGRKHRRQAWYAAYVAVIAAVAYGFPLVQAVFKSVDRAWLQTQLSSPVAIGLGIAAVAVALWSAYAAGDFRGPVVPPLPWIDHVVSTPIDRAHSVRRWWRTASGGTAFAGGLLGATVGAGVTFAGLLPWLAVAPAVVAGAVLGRVAGALWLWGQVRSAPGPDRGPAGLLRPRRALRALHVETLRNHSANTSTIGGSVLTGDLRAARLQLARPVRHARHVRLRASGPVMVVVRRDLLGLRRQPTAVWTGLGYTVLAVVVLVWTFVNPVAPVLAAGIGLVPAYLGFGAWAEGLRMQADNAGTPSLLGVSGRVEAAGHLVVPTVLMLIWFAVGLAVASLAAPVPAAAIALVPVVVGVLVGGHLLAAFRGAPPAPAYLPEAGPFVLVLWYFLPAVAVLACGVLDVWLLPGSATGAVWAFVLSAGIVRWGFARVSSLTDAHRI